MAEPSVSDFISLAGTSAEVWRAQIEHGPSVFTGSV